jgi:hypothetical protein
MTFGPIAYKKDIHDPATIIVRAEVHTNHRAAQDDAQNASSIARNRLRSVASCISSHFDNGSLTFEVDTTSPGDLELLLPSGTNGSQCIPESHLLVSIGQKMIEILDADQSEPRIFHVRNSVERDR